MKIFGAILIVASVAITTWAFLHQSARQARVDEKTVLKIKESSFARDFESGMRSRAAEPQRGDR